MTIKNTRAQSLISNLGSLMGVHYSEKTFKNIESILKHYRAFKTSPFNSRIIKKKPTNVLIADIYESFLSSEQLSSDVAKDIALHLLHVEQLQKAMSDALDSLKAFDEYGSMYYTIISKNYFESSFPSNTKISLDLKLSPGAYSYRKTEATMAFGIMLWQQLIKYWDTIKDDAKAIEENLGRANMLSELCEINNLQ